ncbi:MAG: EAL domain-containing protein [Acidobacteriota bacterium]
MDHRTAPRRLQRLLFIDDDAGVRRTFGAVLRRAGYEVDLASDGYTALENLEVWQYDAVVSDLLMPGIDGLMLIDQLHDIDATCSTVLITGAQDLQLPAKHLGEESIVSVLNKPVAPDELLQTVARATEMTAARRRAAKKMANGSEILLVEDSAADERLVRHHLERSLQGGYRLTVAHRLQEALDLLHTSSFDLILSDLSLPDARGLDAVAQLRALASHIPIVVLTGLKDAQMAQHALGLGAQDYLQKSDLDPKQLSRALRYAAERKRAEARLAFMAHYDHLTELGNRAQFAERVGHAISRSVRSDTRFAVLYIDLDRFKPINDSYGHEVGDAVLKEVALRIRAAVREPDSVARPGGDEFAVLLEDVETRTTVATVAQRILKSLEQPIAHGTLTLEVGASLGVGFFPDDGTNLDLLLRAADAAMYVAKEDGGSRVHFASHVVEGAQPTTSGQEVERAFENGELEFFYQPQVDLRTNAVAGFEALLRWPRSIEETLLPSELLPRLEAAGIMNEVGAWSLLSAARQLERWPQGHRRPRIAVNMTLAQLTSTHVFDTARRLMSEGGLARDSIEIELNEAALISDTAQARELILELQRMGLRVALDNFGEGRTSLFQLRELPVQKLKLHRSFLEDVQSPTDSAPIATCVISMAEQMGLEMVAEGVETPEQLQFLQREGCPTGQGFFLQGPISTAELGTYLTAA